MNRTVRSLRAVLQLTRAAVLTLVCSLLIAPAVAQRVGWDVVVVGGGSMHPTIPLGSLLIERPFRPADVRSGAVVTYRSDNGVRTTHRITSVRRAGDFTMLHTQGDANIDADATPIESLAVVGLVVRSVPLLGYALLALQQPTGLVTALLALGSLSFLALLLDGSVRRREGPPPRRRGPDGSPGTTG